MRLYIVTVAFLFVAGAAVAQTQSNTPPPEASQFDFWVGEWDATWGENLHGVNRVTKRWGMVVVEEFDGRPGMALEGHSVSVYDVPSKQWKQTWVDNQGSYLDFTGGFADGRMTLSRSFEQNGKTVHQRMVWYDIQPKQFDWNWERSLDGGKTWEVVWKIRYVRRA
jgi:hypothetical protein